MSDSINDPELSVVIPVKNEAENIAPLVHEIDSHLVGRIVFEIVVVDDGSDDGTDRELSTLLDTLRHVRVVRHERSCGQSQATISGALAAKGEWIATIDGDGQNPPADILKLLDARSEFVLPPTLYIGHRASRQDSFARRLVSKVANGVRGLLLGDRTPDSGCGLKLLRRSFFLDLPRFDALHRFMPALILRMGGQVISVPIGHRPRTKGVSKYGIWRRGAVGVIDMIGVAWLQMRYTRPVTHERRRKN